MTAPWRSLGSASLVWQQRREQAALRSHIPECQSGDVTLPVLTELADPANHSPTLLQRPGSSQALFLLLYYFKVD